MAVSVQTSGRCSSCLLIFVCLENTKHCHTGARLPLWLNSMLAALSRVKDPDSKANITESVHSEQTQAHTPIKGNAPSNENIGNPCKHNWLLANAHRTEAYVQNKWTPTPPKKKKDLPIKSQYQLQQCHVLVETGDEILQCKSPNLGPQSSQARTYVLSLMVPMCTYWEMDTHGPPMSSNKGNVHN